MEGTINNAGWNTSISARGTVRIAPQDVGHHPRIDNEGYILPRDQWSNQRKTNRQGVIKVFIGNIDYTHHVEHVYEHLSKLGVTVMGLYHGSHPSALRTAFELCYQ